MSWSGLEKVLAERSASIDAAAEYALIATCYYEDREPYTALALVGTRAEIKRAKYREEVYVWIPLNPARVSWGLIPIDLAIECELTEYYTERAA